MNSEEANRRANTIVISIVDNDIMLRIIWHRVSDVPMNVNQQQRIVDDESLTYWICAQVAQ